MIWNQVFAQDSINFWHFLLVWLSPGNCLFPFFLVFSIVSKCLKIAKSWKLWSEKTGKYHPMINVVTTWNKRTTIRFLIFVIKRHLFQILSCELVQDLVGWIYINLLPQSLAWLLGFGANHSLLFFVQYWHYNIETRQIQYLNLDPNKEAFNKVKDFYR